MIESSCGLCGGLGLRRGRAKAEFALEIALVAIEEAVQRLVKRLALDDAKPSEAPTRLKGNTNRSHRGAVATHRRP